MAVGGDIIEITWNNDLLGTGVIYAKAAEDSEFDLGGLRSEDDSNMIDGAGKTIRKMNRIRWKFGCVVSWDMNGEDELQKVVDLASSIVETSFTIAHINGINYGCKGSPVGDQSGNGNAATFPLLLSGGGVMSQI